MSIGEMSNDITLSDTHGEKMRNKNKGGKNEESVELTVVDSRLFQSMSLEKR